MIDRLRQLAIFAKTIDHGSFRGAARELRLSPSVVSHHISQLEDHLGVALLYRSTRKLALTREGESLLAATRKMLEAVEGELQGLSASASAPSGELRITLPSVLSRSELTQRIATFTKAYPRIQLLLDFSDQRRELIGDRFDLAIRMGPDAKTSATLRKLFSVERRIVASADYLAAHPPILTPDDLPNFNWLTLAPVQSVPLALRNGEGVKAVVNPQTRLFTNDAQSLYCLAREGAGLAAVPDFLATEDVAAGSMEVVLPDWQLPSIAVYAEWPSNAPKHGLTHLVLKALS